MNQQKFESLVNVFANQLRTMWEEDVISAVTGKGGVVNKAAPTPVAKSASVVRPPMKNGNGSEKPRRPIAPVASTSSSEEDHGDENGHTTGRVKRTTEDLEQLGEKFLAFVTENPGLRIEVINKELGTSTKELALPIRKLMADRSIKTKGEKRATVYFAA